jgi:hypothetical protein
MPGIKARLLNFSYAGFLGNTSPENSLEFIRSITGALRRGEAHMANLDHLPVDGPLREAAERSSGFATRDRLIKPEPHCLMTLASTIDGVYHGFSQGLRAEVRRKKRKIEADFAGKLAIRRYRHEQDLDGVIPNLEQIAKTTYQRGIGVGFHDTAEMQQRLRLCARKGWLRIYVVTIENRPCAFWVGTVTNRTFLSDYNGYDPSLRNYSLGTYLLANMIEEFCNEGVKAIDFGFGQAEYKDRFSNVRRIEASISLFAPTAMGLALNAMRTSTGAIDSAARKILNRTNLLPRIKKLWRQHASHSSSPASN